MNAIKKIILGLIIIIVPGGSALGAYLIKKRYDEQKHQQQPNPDQESDH